MFNRLLILFLSLTITSIHCTNESKVVEGMFNELQREIFKPKQCYTKLLGFYLESEGPNMSLTAGDNVHDLCPSIRQTCCSYEQLVEIHAKARTSHQKMMMFTDKVADLMEKVRQLDDEQLQILLQSIKDGDCEYSEFDGNGDSLDSAIEVLRNEENIEETLKSGMEYYSLKNAGYACAMCDQRSHEAIVEKRKQTPYIQVDLKQCKSFVSDPLFREYVKASALMKQVMIFYGGLSCVHKYHLKSDFKEFIS